MKLIKLVLVILAFSQAPVLAQSNKAKVSSSKQNQENRLLNIKDDFSQMRDIDSENAYLNEVYFSFNSDLLFYPGETQVRLNSYCHAVRGGDKNQAIRVPANKKLRVSSSSVSYFFPFSIKAEQKDGTSVGIECTSHDLKKLVYVAYLLESQIKIFVAQPTYLNVKSSVEQNPARYVSVLSAASAAISPLANIGQARDKVFFSFDKDIVFVDGESLFKFRHCAIHRNAASYPAAKIAKGTIFPVEYAKEHLLPNIGGSQFNWVTELFTVSAKVGSQTESIGIVCVANDNTISDLAKLMSGTATLLIKKTVFKDF